MTEQNRARWEFQAEIEAKKKVESERGHVAAEGNRCSRILLVNHELQGKI